MTHILFVDESGHDRKSGAYEVLAGIAVEAGRLWDWIQDLRQLQEQYFGMPYRAEDREIKGRKFLKRKVFRLAGRFPEMDFKEMREGAHRCLTSPVGAGKKEIASLAQAKLHYVRKMLEKCSEYKCRAFASIVNPESEIPDDRWFLRKDYSFLFERFFCFLEDCHDTGIIVFDELEKTKSHLLISQMENYFVRTRKGEAESKRIIPEPFFVHSELTSGIQAADIIAYLVSWGWKEKDRAPLRKELESYVSLAFNLRYKREKEPVWSFQYIHDLLPQK